MNNQYTERNTMTEKIAIIISVLFVFIVVPFTYCFFTMVIG